MKNVCRAASLSSQIKLQADWSCFEVLFKFSTSFPPTLSNDDIIAFLTHRPTSSFISIVILRFIEAMRLMS